MSILQRSRRRIAALPSSRVRLLMAAIVFGAAVLALLPPVAAPVWTRATDWRSASDAMRPAPRPPVAMHREPKQKAMAIPPLDGRAVLGFPRPAPAKFPVAVTSRDRLGAIRRTFASGGREALFQSELLLSRARSVGEDFSRRLQVHGSEYPLGDGATAVEVQQYRRRQLQRRRRRKVAMSIAAALAASGVAAIVVKGISVASVSSGSAVAANVAITDSVALFGVETVAAGAAATAAASERVAALAAANLIPVPNLAVLPATLAAAAVPPSNLPLMLSAPVAGSTALAGLVASKHFSQVMKTLQSALIAHGLATTVQSTWRLAGTVGRFLGRLF